MKLQYTPSQQIALKKFEQFIKSNAQVFILKGAAGTGKTTILKRMIEMLNSGSMDYKHVVLMAPTGRAAHILHQKTGVKALTIHSQIYSLQKMSIINDSSDKESESVPHLTFDLKQKQNSSRIVYIVDEASLISDIDNQNETLAFGSGKLLSDFIQYIDNCKVIFVGDSSQLPPIGMTLSPALDAAYLKENFSLECEEATLNEVVRQESTSGILKNATRLRTSIASRDFTNFHLSSYSDIIKSENLVDDFIVSSAAGLDQNIIVTFSNKAARDYNLEIRRKLYDSLNPPRVVKGDLLVIARNNYLNGELFNGTIIKVLDCADDDEMISRTIMIPRKDKEGKTTKHPVELKFREVEISFMNDGKTQVIKYYILDNFLDSNEAQLSKEIIIALYIDFKIRNPKLKPSTISFYEAMMDDPFYNSLLCKYGYALTCHKAQGGEWPNVFVDMSTMRGKDNESFFRWAYTAITRSSIRLWHFNSPEFDIFSKMKINPIQKGGNFMRYTPSSKQEDYKSLKFKEICKAAESKGFKCEEDLSAAYQHRIIISDESGQKANFTIWFTDKGYSNKPIKLNSCNNSDFAKECEECLRAEAQTSFKFDDNENKSAHILYGQIRSICDELGIEIVNIVKHDYQYAYHILTSGHAVVGFHHNVKGQFTNVTPYSNLGEEDELLTAFCNKL